LPTESEWEYAARGGNKSRGYKYSGSNSLGDVAWYDGNSGNKPHPVASKSPNELGIYDMTGNVWEWTSDIWCDDYNSSRVGSHRVYRGGSWSDGARGCRVSYRGHCDPSHANGILGLRLAL
jgi:formylglycine-generating enzyme required for sulfatase activity